MNSATLSSAAIAKLLAAAACQQRQLPQVAAPNAQKIVSVLTAKLVASAENAPFLAIPAALLPAAACQPRQLPKDAAPSATKIVSVLTAKLVASEENAPFLATPAALLPAAACQPPRFASAENARPAALTVNAL